MWNGKKAEVYEVQSHVVNRAHVFESKATSMAVHNDHVFCAQGSHVVVCKLNGNVKQVRYASLLPGLAVKLEPCV